MMLFDEYILTYAKRLAGEVNHKSGVRSRESGEEYRMIRNREEPLRQSVTKGHRGFS
jgi:hypothetical protein